MPINIIDYYSNVAEGEAGEKLDWLCDDEWELPNQLKALENWLMERGKKFTPGSYVADIGFGPRDGALGGGGALSVESMKVYLQLVWPSTFQSIRHLRKVQMKLNNTCQQGRYAPGQLTLRSSCPCTPRYAKT